MFERETDAILRTILQRLPQSEAAPVYLKDILAADIPSPIKVFFRADTETLLKSELSEYQKKSRFHHGHPEVRSLQDQINSILLLDYALKRPEFLQRLDDTVHMIVNYLIRPQWTILGVVFEKEPSIPAHSLGVIMRHFGPYEYLREIILHYVREKKIERITREELRVLLWKIDGEYIRRKSGDELARVMQPLFDFFDFPLKTGNNAILIRGILKHFEDKGLTMVLPRLEGEIVQGRTEITRQDLGVLLEDVRRTAGAFQVEEPETVQEHHPERQGDPSRRVSLPSPAEAPRGPNLTDLLTDAERRKFIRRIFNNDETAFTKALENLKQLTTWKQASKYIDEIFIDFNIDPYSSEATRLRDIIFHQHHPRR